MLIDSNLYFVPTDFADRDRKTRNGLTIRKPDHKGTEISKTNFYASVLSL